MQELIDKHLAALERTPIDDKSFLELEAALEGEGRWDELLRLYESRASTFPDFPGASRAMARAGDLLRLKLNNPGRAEDFYRRALLCEQENSIALAGLRAVYEAKGELNALVDVLSRRAAALTGSEAAELWIDLARVNERLNRRDRAVLAFQRAAHVVPERRDALEGAFSNLVSMGRFRLAFDVLEALRARFGGEGLAPRYLDVAQQLRDLPHEHPLALKALETVARLDPANPDAARLKDEISGYRDHWRERVRTLRLEANDERDRKRRARLFLSVALAHASFDAEADARKKAREFLDNALLLWPAMPQALDTLERMAAESNDWKGLDTALEKLAANTKERSAAVDVYVRLATLRVVRFGDHAQALEALGRAVQLDPARADAVGLAIDLLLDQGKAEEVRELIERHLAALSDPRAQAFLRLRLAELLATRLSNPEGARAQLEAVLEADPTCVEAARKLMPLYEALGEPGPLARVLELALPAISDPAEKASALERIAEMQGDLLDNHEAAVRALARALLLRPTRSAVRKELERQAAAAQAWETVVSTYRAAASLVEGEARASYLRRAAQILEAQLGRDEQALATWRQLLELVPGDEAAQKAIEALLARTGSHQELIAGYERALAQTSDPAQRRELLAKIATSLEQDGGNPAAKLEVYRRQLEIDPDSETALESFASACAALERWDELVGAYERLAALGTEPAKARAWRTKRALVLATRLNRKEEAGVGFLELLEEEPSRTDLVSELEKISASGVLSKRIAEALLPRYLAAGDFNRSAAALQTRIAGTDDRPARKQLMIELAAIYEEKLADCRAAFGWLEKAFVLGPDDAAARARLEKLAVQLGSQAELGALFVEIAEGAGRSQLARELLLRAATLAEGVSEFDLSIQALDRALTAGKSPEVFEALRHVGLKAERWPDVERALRGLIELGAGEPRALQLELAGVCERQGKHAEAARALEEALGFAEDDEGLARLARLFEQAGDQAGTRRALERELARAEKAADRERAARLRLKLSKLLEGATGDRNQALQNYAAVLAERPTDPEALAALERMLQAPETREAAAIALEPAYRASKEFRKLVYALEILAEAAPGAAEKAAVLKRAAQIHATDLHQIDLAFATLARALRLTPADAQLRVATRKAAEESDSLETYAEILGESADTAPGPQAVPLLRELAEVSERKLGDRDRAAECYRQVLRLDPDNLDALRGLHRLHRLAERWDELAEVCSRLARVVYDDQERVLLFREAGTLFEGTLDRKEEAAACFRALAEADPLDRDAALALERLYDKLARPQDLAFALELRRAQEGGAAAGREAAFRLAELKRNVLNDVAGALQIFEQILADDPAHTAVRASLEAWAKAGGSGSIEAVRLLDPVLERAGEHPRRVALREARLSSASGEERARLAAEIRHIDEVDMGRPELAFMAACRHWAEGIDPERVQPELERLARDTNNIEALADVYEEAAESAHPGDEHAALALRRAAQLRAQLGEFDKAVGLWKDLLQEVPGDREGLEALAKLHERNQNARELAEVYKQQASLAPDAAQRAQLLLQAGLAKLQTGDAEAAVELGRAVIVISPKSREALELLDRAYEKLEHIREHADVLRMLAEVTTEPPTRRSLLLRRAALLEEEGDASEAVDAYAKVLAESPGESAAVAGLERLFQLENAKPLAARVLESLYRSIDDALHLCDVLEVKATLSTKEERLEVLQEIARLRESLGQRPLAFTALLRCFRDDSSQTAIRDELERLAAETGSFEELAAAYEDELEREPSESLQLELWRRLGTIYGDRLGRPDRAAQAWEQVARRAPDDAAVLETLCRLYRRTSSQRELSAVLWRQVRMAPSAARMRELLVELAQLAEEKLDDHDAAITAWQEILKLNPEDVQAKQILSRLLLERGRFDELGELLAARASQAEREGKTEQSLELLVELGRVKLTRLSDPRGALSLFSTVLERRPGHPGAVAALEEMARGDGGLKAEAALALEPVFSDTGDHLKLVQMYEARAQGAAPLEKAALLRRIAKLYAGPLESADMAYVYALKALEAAPDDAESLAYALEQSQAAGSTEELSELIAEVVDRASTDEARVALQRASARLLTSEPDDQPQAVAAFKRLLELAPGDPEALEGLASLYRAGEQWSELLEVLRRQLAAAHDDEARAALLRSIGELQDERLGDHAAAIATLRRLLDLSPDDSAALERLDRLCQRGERWAELADTLAREIALAQKLGRKEAELTLKFRLAELREQRLLDRTGALALLSEILEVRPGHEQSIARLEAILAREPSCDEAGTILANALRAAGNHPKLAALLEDRAAVVADGPTRKRHLLEVARIRLHLERSDLAFLALCKALREDPADLEVRGLIARTAEQAETYEELAELLKEELPKLDGAEAASLCLELAGIYEQKLGDDDSAIEFYEQARTFDLSSAARALPALDRLYKESAQWEKLADTLQSMVGLAEEPSERTTLLFRLGQLADEKLDPPSPDRAARAFEQILELDPGHLPAARALERLYENARRFDRLFAILEVQRGHVSGADRERLLARMAEVAANGLKDPERAIGLYNELLGLNPRSEAAFLALEGLYEDTEKHDTLVELLNRRLAITVDPREITRLSDKLGRVLTGLGRHQEAIAAFRAALERDPRHRRSLEWLRDIYEKYAPSEELASVLRRLIPLQDDAESVKGVRLRLAEVLAAIGKREDAIEAARRVLDLEPHAEKELLRTEELFRSQEAWTDLVRAMEGRAELLRQAERPAEAITVLYAIAEVQTKQLRRREAAAPAYERVLELGRGERQAFDALREIYSALGDWRRYAAACERYLPGIEQLTERVEVLKELGQVQEARLGHKDLAFLSYCRAFGEAPQDDEVRTAVHRLADETGSHDELATVYEEVVDGVEKGPLAEKLYLTLARLQDEKLDEPEDAESSLRKVLEFDPANGAALEALAAMFSRRGRDSDYVLSLEQKYEAAVSIEERKAILREIAHTQDVRMQNAEEAASAYLRALELEPDRDTLRTLADLYRRERKWRETAETLMRARDFETEPQLRAKLQVEISELHERELSDDDAAVAGYQLALEFDPENRDALWSLERLYTKLDRPAELLGTYDAQLRQADARERVKILFKTAGIWEDKFQNLENADACLEAVLAVDPTNLQAIKGLERLRLLDAEAKRPNPARWEDLLRAYDRHLGLKPEVREQVELLVAMGEVQYKELKRIDKAAQTFHRALDLDPRSLQAMHALGLLYERSGNWPFALDMLAREAQQLGSSKEAVEVFHRVGKINEDMLLDAAAAKAAYQNALEIDQGYLPSLRALKGMYEVEKDWDHYLEVLVQEANSTVDIEERTLAYLDVARFYQDSREDRDSAARYYEEALKLTPDSMEAARPLADIYVAREEWEKAEAMLDIVAGKLSESLSRDPQAGMDLCRQLYRLGYVCEKMKKSERALGAYERAYKLDSTYLPSAEGYANLLVAAERHADALSVYQAILIHHREDLTDLEVVEYYAQTGDLYRKLGQAERAQKEYDKALAIDGNHEPSLRAQVELSDKLGDWEEVLKYRARLADLLEGDARFEVVAEMGRVAKERLNDSYRAVDAYVDALKLRGDSLEVLDALLGLYRETRQSHKAVEILERMLVLTDPKAEPARARKLHFALGEIYRDEIKDVVRAAEAFNKALDIDYRFLQAFAALESMLGSARQWELLEQNYHRMIQRLPKSEETHVARMTLFKALGDYYENVKKDKAATRQVYQVVARGLPDDPAVLEKYAALASEQEGSEKEAIEAWRKALPLSEAPAKVVNQLARLAAKAKDYDAAFVAAQVAAHLVGEVGTDEREILTKLTPYARRREQAQKQLTNHMWTTLLFHPKVRGPMGEILALVYDKLGPQWAKRPSSLGIDLKSDRIDPGSKEFALDAFRYVQHTLDLEGIELYSPYLVFTRERLKKGGASHAAVHPDKELLLEALHTHPLSLKAGGKLFGEQVQKELYFALGRAMAFCRPELALARVLPAGKLEAVFQAALLVGVPGYRPTADPNAVEAEYRVIEKIAPQFRAALSRLGRDYVKQAAADDVRSFIEGVELTANRAGALLCTDLEVAKGALTRETGAKAPLRARIRDLLLFSLSLEFAELREGLGLKIEIKLPGSGGR